MTTSADSQDLRRATERALIASILGTVVMATGDPIVRIFLDWRIPLIRGVTLGLLFGLLYVVRKRTLPVNYLVIALGGLTVLAVAGASIVAVTHSTAVLALLYVAVAMTAAAFIPWGMGGQFYAVGLMLALYLGAAYATSGIETREVLGVVVSLCASLFVMSQLDRVRAASAKEEQERRLREEQLRRERSFFKQVIDTNPHPVFAKDKDGRFRLVNEAVAELYGTTVEALVGRTDEDFNPKTAEVAHFRRADLDVLESRRETITPEEVITDARGRMHWLRTIKRPIVDVDGETTLVLGVSTDITEQKAVREFIQEEARIASILARVGEQIIGGLGQTNLRRRLCEVTREATGCRESEMWALDPGDQCLKAIEHSGTAPEIWEAIRVLAVPLSMADAVKTPTVYDDVQLVLPDEIAQMVQAAHLGAAPPLGCTVLMWLRRGDQITGLLSAVFDAGAGGSEAWRLRVAHGLAQLASLAIENAVLLDQLDRANRLKSEFVATMSHELRTPLNVILGYGELLMNGGIGTPCPEQSEALGRMRENALHLLDLVNTTLDVSRLEAGHVALDVETVTPADLLATIEHETRDLPRAPGVSVEWETVGELPELRTDPVKVKVVLKNLVGNALKFTKQGGVYVLAEPSHGGVVVSVRDTGIGISPTQQESIFEAFRQGDGSIAVEYGGVGLGLFIVRRLVDAIGATISLESALGAGSTFRVWLPPEPPLTTASATEPLPMARR